MNLLFNNWAFMIVVIGRQEEQKKLPQLSITDISKKMDSTYSNLATLTYELEIRGLISREKNGRRVLISLTNKGRTIYEALETIIETTNIKNYQGLVINKWRINKNNQDAKPLSKTEIDAHKKQPSQGYAHHTTN